MCTDPEQLASSNESIRQGSGRWWQAGGGEWQAMTCRGKKRDLYLNTLYGALFYTNSD